MKTIRTIMCYKSINKFTKTYKIINPDVLDW
jgi:hypothetical protein